MAGEGCTPGRGDRGHCSQIGARGDTSHVVLFPWLVSSGGASLVCAKRAGWGALPWAGGLIAAPQL